MSPCAITATADKRNLSAKTAPGIFFKSDWRIHDTGFNANNSVSPIGRRSSQTNVSIKIVQVKSVIMGGKVKLDSTFPIATSVCRRSPQTPGTNVPYARNVTQTYRRSCRRPITDP